jgi:hypothetical protein
MLVALLDVRWFHGRGWMVKRWLIPFRDAADQVVDWVLVKVETFLLWTILKQIPL